MNTREKILRAIVDNPGLTTREIMAIAQLSRTNTREHLQKLESMGSIYSETDAKNPNKHRYYPIGESPNSETE
ncbi:winged helix-turn-helix transcriptional regulator [Planktothrix sp. FACHB-1355]|uniref:Winged helix-turn-helix transcriptional regulator n=1 Tax=Aerosakkonema funiforme FACHB-1375 TaxID=2949571 RepID=A0A926VN67_9CYAN|nr:winged helix-turn-helix transcriptional regulator [Aerosakkonema funiforme FACHB-1375]MBD3559479.1 winged helix-turn-helix transcriptional regulator [Planktothrix sp. FACHB-1355]